LPVTVQVAWTLVKRDYTVTPELLSDAREHLLRGINPTLSVDATEWMAEAWTLDYLARRVHKTVQPPPVPGPELSIPAAEWRNALIDEADRGMHAALRLMYAERLPLEKALQHLRCRPAVLTSAQERLRDHVRIRLAACETWTGDHSDAQVDTVLRRLATLATPGGPGPLGLMSQAGLAHAETCPRTNRAIRLIRRGHLQPQTLLLPRNAPHPARGTITVVGIHVHPDAQRAAGPLTRFLEHRGLQPAPGTWLLPDDLEAELYDVLTVLAVKGRPARHHVRATRIEDSGRWSGETLLGPVAHAAIDATRAVSWGSICGRPPLPLPAPPPPSSRNWWAAALVVAAATIALGITVAQPEPVQSSTPIEASFRPQDGGWEVAFDVPESALLDVISVQNGEVRILHRSIHSARGAWATGYGRFKARIPGDQVAFVASPRGIDDLERMVLDASTHPEPLVALEETMRRLHPRADLVRSTSAVAAASVAAPTVSPL
jgi:hypothetical protein